MLAVEPSTSIASLVNRHKTALVLGGSEQAQLPPPVLGFRKFPGARNSSLYKTCVPFPIPPEVNVVTCIWAPCVHPQALPLRLHTALLLHGRAGLPFQNDYSFLIVYSFYKVLQFVLLFLEMPQTHTHPVLFILNFYSLELSFNSMGLFVRSRSPIISYWFAFKSNNFFPLVVHALNLNGDQLILVIEGQTYLAYLGMLE